MNRVLQIAQKIVSLIFRMIPHPRPADALLRTTKVVAHRGVHENNVAVENTLAAFRLAPQNGIWGIEFDIRFTKDNIPVVHHDPDCGRLFQHPEIVIADVSFAELRAQVPDLPTFAEVLSEVGGRTHLMIELKEDPRPHPHRIESLRQALAKLRPVHDYHFLCLQPDYLEGLTFAPKTSFMDVIIREPKLIMRRNHELEHGAISGHFLHFNNRHLQAFKVKTKPVGVGFIDSRNSLYREINRGADFIFTNHPLRLMTLLTEANRSP